MLISGYYAEQGVSQQRIIPRLFMNSAAPVQVQVGCKGHFLGGNQNNEVEQRAQRRDTGGHSSQDTRETHIYSKELKYVHVRGRRARWPAPSGRGAVATWLGLALEVAP